MAFPQDRLPIKQELLINGTWVDVTSYTRNSDNVAITRGYAGEQSSLSAGSATFTLNNRDGRFTNKNPLSPYFGKIGRNTQYRTSITENTTFVSMKDVAANDGSFNGSDGAEVWTADKAVLDITGDIDIRADIEPDDWRGRAGQFLAGKYLVSGNQRSWYLAITRTGYLSLVWSPDGTSGNRRAINSTSPLPTSGRIAVRATLDVDNGAGGCTATFYTATTISGSYSTLGSAVVSTGTTSIFSGAARLELGDVNNAAGRRNTVSNFDPFVGRIYAFELRSGIGGTLVAKMDATAQAAGTTSWSDGLGTPNTWTLAGSAEITAQNYRFWGEIASLPQRWDTSGTDIYSPIRAADLIQRLGQGAKPLHSSIFRNLSAYPSAGDGYWPMEDGSSATKASALWGNDAFVVDGSFTTDPDLPGSEGVLRFNNDTGTAYGDINPPSSGTGTDTFLFYFKVPSLPPSSRNFMHFYLVTGSGAGTVYDVQLGITPTSFTLNFFDSAGVNMGGTTSLFGAGVDPTQWLAMRVKLTQSANVDWDWGWYPVGAPVLYGVSGTIVGAVAGRIKSWNCNSYVGKSGFSLAHVIALRRDVNFAGSDFTSSTNAYTGETVLSRWYRLLGYYGIPAYSVGSFESNGTPTTATMGPQRVNTLLALLQECADVDGGIIYGPRDKFGLGLRLRNSMVNRAPVELDYSQNALSGELEPEQDDTLIRNDVTVTRFNGGSRRSVQEFGALNVNEPATDPNGVGLYDVSIQRNVDTDDHCAEQAGWERFLGTWDELRYARVQVELARQFFVTNPTLTSAVRNLEIGRPIRLSHLPAWLPPDDVDLLIIGYTETLLNRQQQFTWNTRPYGPYRANDLTGSSDSRRRLAATPGRSVTAIDISNSDLLVPIETATGKLWGTTAGKPGNFPMDIVFGGERMTISAIGTWMQDTFTRTVSSTWGSTGTGGFPWTNTGGSASDFSVNGSVGIHNLSTTAVARVSTLDLNATITQARLNGVQMPVALTGAGGTCMMSIRLGTTTDYVAFNVVSTTAGTQTCYVEQIVGGVTVAQDSTFPSTGLSATASMTWLIAYDSSTVRGKVWASGSNEPGPWSSVVSLTQPNVTEGDLTLRSTRNASSTNAAPFNVQWDNLTLPRMQAFTISARSVNGVVKSHGAGAVTQVAEPFYVSRT